MLRSSTLTILALAAGFVAAQTTPGPCILTCSAQATGCQGPTDLPCVCTNTTYQQAVLACIQQQCPDQVAAATQLQGTTCAADAFRGVTSGILTSSSLSYSRASRPTTTVAPAIFTSSGPATSSDADPVITSGAATATSSGVPPATSSGAAFKNAPVAPAMGAFAAFIGAAIF